MVKIYKGETPMQELIGEFKDELEMMIKKAALEFGCPVENVKWRKNNIGMVEFEMMTDEEFVEMKQQEFHAKQVRDIKKSRGVYDN